jgi:hypothetical protein
MKAAMRPQHVALFDRGATVERMTHT